MHPKAAGHAFFSSAHGTFSMINRMLGHKTILNKFKRIKIISSFFSDHSGMKLEVNYLSKVAKYTNFRGQQHATKCFKREIKIFWDKNENMTCQNLWDAAKAVLRGKFTAMNASLKKEERKVSSKQPNFIHLKKLEKEEQSPKLI